MTDESFFVNRLFAEATSRLQTSGDGDPDGLAFLRRYSRPCVYLVGCRTSGENDTVAGVVEEDAKGRFNISIDLDKAPATGVFPRTGCFSLNCELIADSFYIPFSANYTAVKPTVASEDTSANITRTSLMPIEGLSLPWVWPSEAEYDPVFPDDLLGADLCWMACELRSRFLSHVRSFDRLISLGGHPFGDDNCSHWSDDGCILIAEIGLNQFDIKMRAGEQLRFFVDRQLLPLQHCNDVWCAS